MRKLIMLAVLAIAAQAAFAADYTLLFKGKATDKFPANPQRVVVMDFSSLDTMQELGLSSVVAAVPKVHLPKYLPEFKDKKYTDVGGLMEFDIEKIYKLSPDLIIISNRQAKSFEKLSRIAPTVNINIDGARYIDSFKANTLLLGKIWGKEEAAKKLIADYDKAASELRNDISKSQNKGLIVMYNAGKFSAYGPGSRFGIIHDVFGMKSADVKIQISNHGKSVNSEYIAKTNPDYLFVVDRDSVVTGKSASKGDVENKLIQTTNAFKHNKIAYLPADYWYLANGGIKSMMLMMKDIRSIIP
jgi:iron complex transport system substrate-binding protein